jgi:chemotaxis protein methyltransferase CheR
MRPLPERACRHAGEFQLGVGQFEFLRQLVGKHAGIELSDAKRELVHGRLSRRIRVLRLQGFDDYCKLLRERPAEEMGEFINAITTNLTSFFRETHHFDFLRQTLVPAWVKRDGTAPRARIWSAGCSTGEEPYSIAITLHDALGGETERVAILATDIDTNVLATAKRGTYAVELIDTMPPEYRRYLLRGAGCNAAMIRIKPEICGLIRFRQLNLMGRWPVNGPLDVVFCRNVVIYFNKDTQRRLFARYADVIAPGGYLIIGHSETLYNVCDRFELVGRTVYRRLP